MVVVFEYEREEEPGSAKERIRRLRVAQLIGAMVGLYPVYRCREEDLWTIRR